MQCRFPLRLALGFFHHLFPHFTFRGERAAIYNPK
jgi:hypothetical protein